MDYLSSIRLKNLFPGTETPPANFGGNMPDLDLFGQRPMNSNMGPSMAQPMMQPQDDVNSRMRELYTPETTSIDKFNEMSSQYPQRKEPGKLRKIGAIALSTLADSFGPGGGQAAFGEMMGFGPHKRAVEDWENQIGPLKDAANLERQSNANERTMAYQTISARLKEEAQAHKEKNDEIKSNIAQQRANVYQMKSLNPDLKFDFSGPTVLVSNPRTGEVKNSGIETGNLSDADKMALSQEDRLEQIAASGGEARETEGVRQENRATNIEKQGEQNRLTRQTPSGAVSASGNRTELSTQTKARQFSKAQEAYNTHPEWRRSIKLGTNDFRIDARDAEMGKQINAFIYGAPDTDRRVTPPAPTGGQTKPLTKTQRNTTTGATRQIFSYDGGKTWGPARKE